MAALPDLPVNPNTAIFYQVDGTFESSISDLDITEEDGISIPTMFASLLFASRKVLSGADL
jgi:hypothetical protein